MSYINTNLSHLTPKQKREYIHELGNITIEYRDSLNLPSNLEFGIEIEAKGHLSNLSKYPKIQGTTNKNRYDYHIWYLKTDNSLTNNKNKLDGRELSSPVFHDTKETWQDIKRVCNLIKQNGGYIDEKCALHIHGSGHYLFDGSEEANTQTLLNLILLTSVYEPVFYNLNSPEFPYPRKQVNMQAAPILRDVQKFVHSLDFKYLNFKTLLKKFSIARTQSLNFQNLITSNMRVQKYTVEARTFNGTLEEEIVQNTVNFFMHFLKHTKTNADTEKLLSQLKNCRYDVSRELLPNAYQTVPLAMYFELADLIYDNDLDKAYFIKQTTHNKNL